MNEKMNTFKNELSAIAAVVEKLLTKQNSGVFDKVCVKCEDFYNKIAQIEVASLSKVERTEVIGILKTLLELCIKLKSYKEYLISVISSNITALNQEAPDISPEKENNIKEFPQKEDTHSLALEHKDAA